VVVDCKAFQDADFCAKIVMLNSTKVFEVLGDSFQHTALSVLNDVAKDHQLDEALWLNGKVV